MKPISYHYKETCLVAPTSLHSYEKRLAPEIAAISTALNNKYETPYAFAYAPHDTKMLAVVHALIKEKKALAPSMMVLVGIGGSSLGTRAVHEALNGTLYNDQLPPCTFYCAETVDTDYLYDLLLVVEQELQKEHVVLIVIASKSGTTTETVVNATLFVELVRRYHPEDYHRYIVTITDTGSALHALAQSHHFSTLEVAKQLGGRFSVFSPVGLFPLGMLDIPIDELISGAQQATKKALEPALTSNSAAASAAILAHHHAHGINVHNMFLFSVELAGIGAWYRQLMGESIGKAFDRQGTRVETGIIPITSIGSTDLHSVGQLYLGGPRTIFTTFVTVAHPQATLAIPLEEPAHSLAPRLQERIVGAIMDAIVQGTTAAFASEKRPFSVHELPEISAVTVGQLLQELMFEMVYLGFLMNVNPFDQPQVELYKHETRKILAHE